MSSWRTPREESERTGWFGGELLGPGDPDYDSNKSAVDPHTGLEGANYPSAFSKSS